MAHPSSLRRSRFLWKTFAFVSAALAAGACSDSRSSVAPLETRFDVAVVPCKQAEAAAIQQQINVLFGDGGLQNAAASQFGNVARKYCDNSIDDARAKMFTLVEFVIGKYIAGQVMYPGTPGTTTTLFELISNLYQFVGLNIGSSGISAEDLHRAAWDGAVGIAQPGQRFTIQASSGDFASTTDAGFFVKAAIVVVSREPDGIPFQSFGTFTNDFGMYTEYPPRYKIFTLPKDAQANYGHAVTDNSPRAYTGICPGDPHPAVSTLRLLRVRDPNDEVARPTELLPLSTRALHLLNCTPKADSPPQIGSLGSLSGSGMQQLARASRVVAGRFAGTIGGFFAPRALYAWDLGVGGSSLEYSGFVPVDPTPQ